MKKAYEKSFINPQDMTVPSAHNAPITAITISRTEEYPYDSILKVEYKKGKKIMTDKVRLSLAGLYDFKNITANDLHYKETIRTVSFSDRKQKVCVVILAEETDTGIVYSFFEADQLKIQIHILSPDRKRLHDFLEMF